MYEHIFQHVIYHLLGNEAVILGTHNPQFLDNANCIVSVRTGCVVLAVGNVSEQENGIGFVKQIKYINQVIEKKKNNENDHLANGKQIRIKSKKNKKMFFMSIMRSKRYVLL